MKTESHKSVTGADGPHTARRRGNAREDVKVGAYGNERLRAEITFYCALLNFMAAR